MEIHQFLHLSGGVDALGPGAADVQGTPGNLPAARGQNQLSKRNFPAAVILTGKQGGFVFGNGQNRGVQRQLHRFRKILPQLPGVFHAGFVFAEAPVGALEQHTSKLTLPVSQKRPRSGTGLRRSNARRSAADDEDIIVLHGHIPPAASRLPRCSGCPGTGPCPCPPGA